MNGKADTVAALQAMLGRKRAAPGECCDYCAEPVGPEHAHLVDLQARRILCSCRPCYLVLEPSGAAGGRYKAVPTAVLELGAGAIDAAAWERLHLPIGLAFFFVNSSEERAVAFYPGPAGATESLLALDDWTALAAGHAAIAALQPDVEALLVDRRRGYDRSFIVPIDVAYALVGQLRSAWRGFDGGAEARECVEAYFERLHGRAVGERTR